MPQLDCDCGGSKDNEDAWLESIASVAHILVLAVACDHIVSQGALFSSLMNEISMDTAWLSHTNVMALSSLRHTVKSQRKTSQIIEAPVQTSELTKESSQGPPVTHETSFHIARVPFWV